MNPSKEVKNYYRKVIVDAIYKDIDSWYSGDDEYCYNLDNKVIIKINKKPIPCHSIWLNDKVSNRLLFSMNKGNFNTRFMVRKLRKYMKSKEQHKLDAKMMEYIPLTTKRRLKIEKIYK